MFTSKLNKLVLASVLALSAVVATSASAELRRATIGTNPQGTNYFVIGGALSKVLADKAGINATAQPYSGSSAYLPLVNAGEVTMGLSSSLDSGMGYKGIGDYEQGGRLQEVRALMRLWPLPYAYFARADSGVKTIADLKGKRVAVGLRANVSLEAANRAMLSAGGVDPEKDVTAVTIDGLPAGFAMVTEGALDASVSALGIPLMRQAQAAIPGGVVILDVSGDDANTEFLSSQVEGLYLAKATPGPNNPGVNEEISVTGFDIFLIGSTRLSDDDAYRVVKALHENWAELQEDHGALRGNPASGLAGSSNAVPYHPGAIRYFKEVGLWSQDNDAHEASFKN